MNHSFVKFFAIWSVLKLLQIVPMNQFSYLCIAVNIALKLRPCLEEEWIDQLVLTRMKSCGVHSSVFTYLCKKGFAVCTFPTNNDIVWILRNPMKINGHLYTKTVEELYIPLQSIYTRFFARIFITNVLHSFLQGIFLCMACCMYPHSVVG